MRCVLILHLAAMLAAVEAAEQPTPGPDDRRIAVFAREHVQIELWAPLGAREARALLHNRNELSVLVTYEVDHGLGNPIAYEVDLLGGETRGGDGRYVVQTGGVAAPRCVITTVDTLPITEASGYVQLAEDINGRISIRLYRPETGGDRAYAVLTNADDIPVEVTWEATGLIEGQPLRFTTDLTGLAIKGRDGRSQLPYKPAIDPRFRSRPKVLILSVTRKRE